MSLYCNTCLDEDRLSLNMLSIVHVRVWNGWWGTLESMFCGLERSLKKPWILSCQWRTNRALVDIVLQVFVVFQTLFSQADNERKFILATNQFSVLKSLITERLRGTDILQGLCSECHCPIEITFLKALVPCVNSFLNNYCKNTNDDILTRKTLHKMSSRKIKTFTKHSLFLVRKERWSQSLLSCNYVIKH